MQFHKHHEDYFRMLCKTFSLWHGRVTVTCSSGLHFLKPILMLWSHQNWTWFKSFPSQLVIQSQQQRDEETQTILVELSEENTVNCTCGTSEKNEFTKFTSILTEAKYIHAFLAQSPREDYEMLKELNSAFSLREKKCKRASQDN